MHPVGYSTSNGIELDKTIPNICRISDRYRMPEKGWPDGSVVYSAVCQKHQ